MAINVYLTFYHKYDARSLRKMEIPYFICCYGIPFIPGFTLLFVTHAENGRPYGNAVLWCWLKPKWEVYRIATFYGPVWYEINASPFGGLPLTIAPQGGHCHHHGNLHSRRPGYLQETKEGASV